MGQVWGAGTGKEASRMPQDFWPGCPSGRSFYFLSEGHSRTVRLGEEGHAESGGCRDVWVEMLGGLETRKDVWAGDPDEGEMSL